jgi:AraC-like DNA-binding protein
VAAYWHIKGTLPPGAGVHHRVLPDGCADLLIDCQAAHDSTNSQGILVGPMSAAQEFELRGTVDMVGVRFRPGGASSFFGLPLHHIRDDAVTVSDLPVDCPLRVAQLSEISDSSSRLAKLSAALRYRLPEIRGADWVAEAVLAQFASSPVSEPLAIFDLVRSIGLSERAVERRFLASVGMTLVQFRRLARFRNALRTYAGGCDNWSAIAHAMGYSDQPHLVREFQAWSGLTPVAWAASQEGDAGFVQDASVSIA